MEGVLQQISLIEVIEEKERQEQWLRDLNECIEEDNSQEETRSLHYFEGLDFTVDDVPF